MKQRRRSVMLLAALLLVFALALLWVSGRIASPSEQTPTLEWHAPDIRQIPSTPTFTPGWWNKILPPTETPTPFPQ